MRSTWTMNPQLRIAGLAVFGIVLHLFLRLVLPLYADYPLYVILALGGIPLVFQLLQRALQWEFGSDLLAGMSIVTAILLQEYLAGSFVVLMLSGGQALESYAVSQASRVLEALAKRAPMTAHRIKDNSIQDIPTAEIAIGDIIQVFPHEICPVDGTVFAGDGVMDEAYLTGEPFLISKAPGSAVLSGAINGDMALTIRATKRAQDSRYAMIMRVMQESQQRRPRMRRLADTLGAWYTPLALAIALMAWWQSGESVRFLAVLVIATPCPLLLAIPVAIIGSISICASRGILIKDPLVLEQLPQCKTMIFDKTGTLTYGKPYLTQQFHFNAADPHKTLRLVASLERYSKHPLASAILQEATREALVLPHVDYVDEPKGQGLKGKIGAHEIIITSRKQLSKYGLDHKVALLPEGMGLECVVLVDGKLQALYRFHDSPRSDSISFVRHLVPQHGFNKIMIVSGDRKEEVDYLAHSVGISEIFSSQSPEQKVDIVSRETKLAKTAYLGDGINDAPALLTATVGIAFGQNSDITAEAAGAVVMDSSLETVDELFHISTRMRKIALQSAIGGMLLSILGMIIAAFGYLPPVAGAITQEVIDVFAILNALRTLKSTAQLSDVPS